MEIKKNKNGKNKDHDGCHKMLLVDVGSWGG